MALRVTEIPALGKAVERTKRRAAAYARISTDHEDQLTSYEAQVEYYTHYIMEQPDLEFVEVYADEGITGTSIKHREGFKRMIADAVAGKIDYIITKSVSRFARNTVDLLSTIRLLKEHGVEVFFERENIRTFNCHGELLLSIMASVAQEESRSISENCKWGQRRRFQEGRTTVPFKRFLGYDRGENGKLVINKEQAVIVRRIYDMYMDGSTPYGIAKTLTAEGVPTPGGKEKWHRNVIKSILTNEKYKGDAMLQKFYTEDYLTKRVKKNNGEMTRYYVEGGHEAIIPPQLFDAVQAEMERRKNG